VARLAGLPGPVIARAKALLAELEAAGQRSAEAREATQLGLFAPARDPILDELARLDLAHLTPIEALNLLSKWQKTIGGGLDGPLRGFPQEGLRRQSRRSNEGHQ
jgi:DNA mismatch repair protein MutS